MKEGLLQTLQEVPDLKERLLNSVSEGENEHGVLCAGERPLPSEPARGHVAQEHGGQWPGPSFAATRPGEWREVPRTESEPRLAHSACVRLTCHRSKAGRSTFFPITDSENPTSYATPVCKIIRLREGISANHPRSTVTALRKRERCLLNIATGHQCSRSPECFVNFPTLHFEKNQSYKGVGRCVKGTPTDPSAFA